MKIAAGYCDRWCVKPGEQLEFMLSGEGVTETELQIVRLIHGDEHPAGPGFIEEAVEAECNGTHAVFKQFTQLGHFFEIPDNQSQLLPQGDFTLYAHIYPTLPGRGCQVLFSYWNEQTNSGYRLSIAEDGCLQFQLGDGQSVTALCAEHSLNAGTWYFVAATLNTVSKTISLHQCALPNAFNGVLHPLVIDHTAQSWQSPCKILPGNNELGGLIGGQYVMRDCRREVVQLYNGKIDRIGLQRGCLDRSQLAALSDGDAPPQPKMIARWDPTVGYSETGIGDMLTDVGPHALHAHGYNRPVRAMTGFNWTGREDCFRLDPGQYGGIAFHDDAIIDCNWTPTVQWTIPDHWQSGVYAARLRTEDFDNYVVFFLRPRTPQSKVAMLMPTATYLAYGNARLMCEPQVELLTARTLVLSDMDYLLPRHPDWGLSMYDHHSDGAGVCYSSHRRPMLGMHPKYRWAALNTPRTFPADLSIIYWLECQDFTYDILTDEDLEREGVACLRPYRAIINATHSEYYSEKMMVATEEYVEQGGNLIYTGANGYYWVAAFREDEPWCMEMRRLDVGTRAWQAQPGEHYLATTGERGGIWRGRGRLPQKMLGVGFTSEGGDECKPYRRMPASYDDTVSWIFAGVEGDTFGDFGLALNGAAGLEVDRYDLALGTPPGTWLLASSQGHSDNYPHVSEEITFTYPGIGGTQDPQIRADMTYFQSVNGGAVFSTGSMAWGQALPVNSADNEVSRIMANVVQRFIGD